ncbi:TolC family protein [Cyclobacterium marinum]|uniref:Outer membrane efflux protein n=1 Tax=Cyclobacterium marinum (strain ATCC 25205 / DSM 745 / LMG 13164 / NCIMB 1802) TaxID=880070 RepID=G0J010_CYCMS|nr:TolC family protein [Cyclobacterium marinum]AEL26512.1 outer membrane efflux protein [Cyclobacterium marinum DSM 745]|tara:strand:- start:46472 stop:47701 length:1230 start_codon:yes stop_codon:yes gene_type:complete
MKFTVLSIFIWLIFHVTGFSQTLEDYFVIAAENNPGLKGKYKAFEAALEKIPQAQSLNDPNLSFGYFISPVETRLGPQRMRFSLTQMFPWFGTLKMQGDVATVLAEVKHQEFLDAKNSLYNEVSAIYYPLLEVLELIEIEKENLQILETYKSIATSTYENGKGSMTDLLRVDIINTNAQTNLDVLYKKVHAANARLNALLGRTPDSPIDIGEKLKPPTGLHQFYFDAIRNNPLIESMDLKVQAAELNQRLALKKGLPQLGIGIDYVAVGDRSDVIIEENGRNVIMPTMTMSLPLFRKKYKAAEREALLLSESYQAEKENVSNILQGSFHRFKAEMEIQLDLIDSYDRQIKTSKQTLDLLYSAYANSGDNFEEVLRLQQQLLEYQKMKVKASVAYYVAEAQINYLTAKSY